MQASGDRQSAARIIPSPQSAQVLRQWSTPDTILAITNLDDEDALLFHIVKQVRQGTARIILAQAAQQPYSASRPGSTRNRHQAGDALSLRFAQLVLARMARKLRWVGITCEPILNKAFHAVEIPGLAKSRDVERVIITSQDGQSAMNSGWRIFIDQLLRGSEVPVCIIGGLAFPDPVGERRAGRVSLALSLSSDSETALGFACRFAQERHSRLTLLHVFNKEDGIAEARSILEVASHLPALTLREAELFCPLEIAVREGDPASEILKFDANTNQDFIILRSAGLPQSAPPDSASVSQRIIREARCPVIILGQTAVHEFERSAVGPKSPQSVWEPEAQLRRAGD